MFVHDLTMAIQCRTGSHLQFYTVSDMNPFKLFVRCFFFNNRVMTLSVRFLGPASSVWREWVNWCVEFGIEADAIVAVPYDWRLSGPMLEKRDLYFHKLK